MRWDRSLSVGNLWRWQWLVSFMGCGGFIRDEASEQITAHEKKVWKSLGLIVSYPDGAAANYWICRKSDVPHT
jgi:hypothetical protein